MNIHKPFRSRNFAEAFSFALRGLMYMINHEKNVRIQLIAAILVLFAMFFLDVSVIGIAVLLLAIVLVIVLEMINAAIELLSDIVHPQYSEAILIVKDVSAGAVLLASVGACIVGTVLLVPAFFTFITSL